MGDLIFLNGETGEKIYAFARDYILDLSNGERETKTREFLEALLSTKNYFGVLRPSLEFK